MKTQRQPRLPQTNTVEVVRISNDELLRKLGQDPERYSVGEVYRRCDQTVQVTLCRKNPE